MPREERLLRRLIRHWQKVLVANPEDHEAAQYLQTCEKQLAFFLREPELFRCNTFPPPPHLIPALKRELLRKEQSDPNRSTSQKKKGTIR